MNWHKNITGFYNNIQPPANLPDGVEVLMPFSESEVDKVFDSFYKKYYNDKLKRRLIIGINPGRFGGGVTGIPFTDPIRLANACGIQNSFKPRQELSSLFMYEMMNAYGSIESFYHHFYITSYSPLGFTRDGKNLNYYDDKSLAATIEPFAVTCLQQQLSWNTDHDIAYCLGDGKNYQFLSRLNTKHSFFNRIVPLAHPRFIMQYKLKQKQDYINRYLNALSLD